MTGSIQSVLAVVTARGGSKGLPGKNLAICAGKPLLAWTIEAGLQARCVSDVLVSSDSPQILDFCAGYDIECLRRPDHLATDEASSLDVLSHVVEWADSQRRAWDWLMLLQPTSPLRTARHIDEAFEQLAASSCDGLISVTPATHHPYKAFTLKDGALHGIINDDYPFAPRQSLPDCYFANGALYITRFEQFRRSARLLGDHTLPYVMDRASSVDIDKPADLIEAEGLLLARAEPS